MELDLLLLVNIAGGRSVTRTAFSGTVGMTGAPELGVVVRTGLFFVSLVIEVSVSRRWY